MDGASANLPVVCLIGAGSSGIAVAKALHDRGIPFDCYEKSDRVGGNWVFKNPNGVSSAYRSLHINTSRDRMQYADYPMPRSYPDFPHHSLIAEYFEAYVDHFGFRGSIHFEQSVERAVLGEDGRWEISLATGQGRRYDVLAVANGHHWDPHWPEPPFPGSFDGIRMHSHHYIDPDEPRALRGKRVVVLGMGNSAMDIACELSQPGVARRVFLAARRGAYVIPHYLLGKPLDQLFPQLRRLPWRLRFSVAQAVYRMVIGQMERYGLPRPDHMLGQAHPTISSELLPRLGRGDILPKPNIERLEGSFVRFADGSREPIDAIIYCTGYNISFPFFDESFVAAKDNQLPLFFNVFKPAVANLAFIGLLQPLGAIMPLAEAQGKWLADYLCGDYALPPPAQMREAITRVQKQLQRRYVASRRHTIQVDFDDYLDRLAEERHRGERRAAARGRPLPVVRRCEAPATDRAPLSHAQ